jgi:hypothetical protein
MVARSPGDQDGLGRCGVEVQAPALEYGRIPHVGLARVRTLQRVDDIGRLVTAWLVVGVDRSDGQAAVGSDRQAEPEEIARAFSRNRLDRRITLPVDAVQIGSSGRGERSLHEQDLSVLRSHGTDAEVVGVAERFRALVKILVQIAHGQRFAEAVVRHALDLHDLVEAVPHRAVLDREEKDLARTAAAGSSARDEVLLGASGCQQPAKGHRVAELVIVLDDRRSEGLANVQRVNDHRHRRFGRDQAEPARGDVEDRPRGIARGSGLSGGTDQQSRRQIIRRAARSRRALADGDREAERPDLSRGGRVALENDVGRGFRRHLAIGNAQGVETVAVGHAGTSEKDVDPVEGGIADDEVFEIVAVDVARAMEKPK